MTALVCYFGLDLLGNLCLSWFGFVVLDGLRCGLLRLAFDWFGVGFGFSC